MYQSDNALMSRKSALENMGYTTFMTMSARPAGMVEKWEDAIEGI